jgi:predicted nucleotidyltransferase
MAKKLLFPIMSTEQFMHSTDLSTGPKLSASEILSRFTQLAQADPDIAVLWLYGSRAQDQAHADSDYDLAVAFVSFPEEPLQRRLRPEILALDWAQAVHLDSDSLSIIDINAVPVPLAWEVITSGQVLYQDDSMRLYQEEQRISSRMELDILYHRRRYG